MTVSGGGELVLASTSRWRVELLTRLDVPFTTAAHRLDERGEDHHFAELGPPAFALHLARGKAQSLVASAGGAWILAADQLAVIDEPDGPQLLHKPGTSERAVEQLMRLRGRTHRLITAVVLARGDVEHHEIDQQTLTMRSFSLAEAKAYVAKYQPLHSVGSYHIEDAGIRLFERIEGDQTGVMGLPLLAVCRLLRAASLLP